MFFVYILASKRDGILYVGVTNDVSRRVFEHKQGIASEFTRKYKGFQTCLDGQF